MAVINTSLILQDLLDTSAEETGTVTSHNADGTSTVDLSSGGTVVALGQSVPVAAQALVKDKEVVAETQSLPYFVLDV